MVWTLQIWAWAWAHTHIWTLTQKSHAPQTVRWLPSSSHNHHLNNGLPPCCPQTSPATHKPWQPPNNHTQWSHTHVTNVNDNSVPSTSPTAMSRNPHHLKQPWLPKIRQPPNWQPCTKKGQQWPAPSKQHRNNENCQQQLSNDQRTQATTTTGASTAPGLNRQVGACRN